jgi:hypothetical protein
VLIVEGMLKADKKGGAASYSQGNGEGDRGDCQRGIQGEGGVLTHKDRMAKCC